MKNNFENAKNTRENDNPIDNEPKIETLKFPLKIDRIVDQIGRYRKHEEIGVAIQKIYNKWKETRPGKLPYFDKEFQKEYILFKKQLLSFVKEMRVFIEHPTAQSLDNMKKLLTDNGILPTVDLNEYQKYIEEFETIRKIYNQEIEDIFKQLTGINKPDGSLDCYPYGNCLLFICYKDKDYFHLWDPKNPNDKKAGDTGGFFLREMKIDFNGKKQTIPIIAIRAEIDESLDIAITEKYNAYFWGEYLPDSYKDDTGKDYEDEEGEETEEFSNWREENESKLWDNLIIETLTEKDPYSEGFDFDDEIEILAYRFGIELIKDHEKQHFLYSTTIIEEQEIEKELLDEEDLAEYFETILDTFTIRLGDELIAYMKNAADRSDRFIEDVGWNNLSYGNYIEDEDESEGEGEKDLIKVHDNMLTLKLSESLYFYPRDYQKEVFNKIKKAIGEDSFKKWGVKEKYKKQVLVKFLKTKKYLEKYASKILKKYTGTERKKMIDFLEVEPVTNWPMVYRWANKSYEISRLLTKG
jgi:hypothetical protein